MDQAGEVAETAESDVNEGVGGAYSTLDPYYVNCQLIRQDVSAAGTLPPSGGNRMERTQRKRSGPSHMAPGWQDLGWCWIEGNQEATAGAKGPVVSRRRSGLMTEVDAWISELPHTT